MASGCDGGFAGGCEIGCLVADGAGEGGHFGFGDGGRGGEESAAAVAECKGGHCGCLLYDIGYKSLGLWVVN